MARLIMNDILNLIQLAELLSLNVDEVRALVTREIPHVVLNDGKILVLKSSLMAYLKTQEVGTIPKVVSKYEPLKTDDQSVKDRLRLVRAFRVASQLQPEV
jgi:hypothetical protein